MKNFPLLLFLTLLLQGCVSPQRDMARFLIPGPDQEPAYRAKAMEFVRAAQAGDLNHMLAITSRLSYAAETNSMSALYSRQVIPSFQGTSVDWKSGSKGNIDEFNNAGLVFTGTAHGKKSFSFNIAVMKENGELVILQIAKHHWYD